MDQQLIYLIIQAVILIGSYIIGKYIIPRLSQDDLSRFTYITKWVEQFVKEASTFIDKTGAEKKEYVSTQISLMLQKMKVELTAEQISALIEAAYINYKAGHKEATKEQTSTKEE